MFPLTLTLSPKGEGRPFILPAKLGGILAYFDKTGDYSHGYYDIAGSDSIETDEDVSDQDPSFTWSSGNIISIDGEICMKTECSKTFRVSLVCMPFADPFIPSLALTQLKATLDKELDNRFSAEILYLNHEFTHYLGEDFYIHAISFKGIQSGIGDWIFRPIVFPNLPDNTEEYFKTYYPQKDANTKRLRQYIHEKRQGLEAFLEELIEKHDLDRADIVGFTATFNQNMACFAMAKKLKHLNPEIVTVMGGSNCMPPMGQEIVKQMDQIDFVFSGPALKNFPGFVSICLNQGIDDCNSIKGIFSKTNIITPLPETKIAPLASSKNGICDLMGEEVDINNLIELDYGPFLDAVEENFGHMEFPPILIFETSRGCWWADHVRCTFCSCTDQAKYRAMRPENAVKQFQSLFKFSSKCRHFRASDAVLPKTYPEEVFPFIKPPKGVKISYEVRPTFGVEDMKALTRAGVKEVQAGIESLSTPSLKLMRKGTTSHQNLNFLKLSRMYDIYPYWNVLLGFPGEDEETYKKYVLDIPLLTHLPPPTGAYAVQIHRGNHYFNHPEKYGIDLRPSDFYRLTYPFDEEALSNLAFYFDNSNEARDPDSILMCRWIDKIQEKIIYWQTQWYGESQGRSRSPELFFKRKEGPAIIYDSRRGKASEYQIDDISRIVLERLTRPTKMEELASLLGHIQEFDTQKTISFLNENGLVFQENNYLLSLVLPEKPPEMTCSPKDYGLKGISQQGPP
jgi:ribosomal peptide maturation radical SAM protein 1